MNDVSLIKSRASDLASLAARREYEFVYGAFLSPAEQAEFFGATPPSVRNRLFFYGGCANAERRRAVFAPEFSLPDALPAPLAFSLERERAFIDEILTNFPDENIGCVSLHIRGSSFASLSHRDYMGSILALGIERSVIGDIAVVSEHDAFVFADEKISPFLESELTHVARDSVCCKAELIGRDFVIPHRFESLTVVAASTRIDSVTATLANLSRADAKRLCIAGEVLVNHVAATDPDRDISVGDTVAVRSHGKFIIDSFNGLTRSGRLRLSVRRYI